MVACQSSENKNSVKVEESKINELPPATGGEYEVAVVGYASSENKSIQHLLDTLLGEEVLGIPQREFLFHVNYVPLENFKSLFKRNPKIILLVKHQNDPVYLMIKDLLNSRQQEKIKSGENSFFLLQNVWSYPQVVCVFYASNENELTNTILRNRDIFIEAFKENMKEQLRHILYKTPPSGRLLKHMKNTYNLAMDVPRYFKLIIEAHQGFSDTLLEKYQIKEFLWFRAETKEANNNIMIYTIPYNKNILTNKDMLFEVKTRMDKIVGSEKKDAFMSIDTTNFYYILKPVKLKYVNAVELRGLWQMENDFMGGPYINYFVPDYKNKRIIVAEGFIYAPGADKKPFIHRMEAIMETLRIY